MKMGKNMRMILRMGIKMAVERNFKFDDIKYEGYFRNDNYQEICF